MKKASKKKSILKGIIDFGMYNTLEERLRNSPEYKKSRKRVGKALKKLDDLGLSEEQMDVIDDVLTVCNENAAIYGTSRNSSQVAKHINRMGENGKLFGNKLYIVISYAKQGKLEMRKKKIRCVASLSYLNVS